VWSRLASALLVGLCSSALLGCSPVVRLRLRVVALDASRLQVTGVKACPPAALAPPAPSAGPGDAFHVAREADGNAVVVTASFRGSHCGARLTAWLDRSADGKAGSGDLVGSSATIELWDRGVIRGNLTEAADLALTTLP
jgi:hypothetical protein